MCEFGLDEGFYGQLLISPVEVVLEVRTKYQPVGLSVSPILLWDESTMRTRG